MTRKIPAWNGILVVHHVLIPSKKWEWGRKTKQKETEREKKPT
jgi:hypothetical protein